MADRLEVLVDRLLTQGLSKHEIRNRLSDHEADGLDFLLSSRPYPEDAARYRLVNWIIILLLAVVTLKKIAIALGYGPMGISTLAGLVVPGINIYILKEISRFRRMGYQFLMIIAPISLINAENRQLPELVFMPVLAMAAGFMFWRLFYTREKNEAP